MSDEVKVLSVEGDSGNDIKIGDITRVVVQDIGDEGDPIAYLGGRLTIVHTDGQDVGFGDTLRVKIADVQSNRIDALVVGDSDG